MEHSEIKTTAGYAHRFPQLLVSRIERILMDGRKSSIIAVEIARKESA